MSKIKSVMAAALTLAVVGSAANADVILNLTTKIVKSTVAGTNTLVNTINSSNYQAPLGTIPQDYQIEVDATVTGIPAGQSVGDLLFDATITPSADATVSRPATSHYNFVANNPIWTDDAGTGHQDFSTAADKGAANNDLVAVTFVVDNGVYSEAFGSANDPGDPRNLIANGTSFKLGTYDILWSGTGTVSLNVTNAQFAPLDDTTLVYGTVQNGGTTSAAVLSGNPGVITPEPASLGLLALGGAALIARRRKA